MFSAPFTSTLRRYHDPSGVRCGVANRAATVHEQRRKAQHQQPRDARLHHVNELTLFRYKHHTLEKPWHEHRACSLPLFLRRPPDVKQVSTGDIKCHRTIVVALFASVALETVRHAATWCKHRQAGLLQQLCSSDGRTVAGKLQEHVAHK